MIKLLTRWLTLALCGLLMVSCQKAVYEENEPDDGEGVTLRFNVTQFEQIPFDKAFSKTRGTQVDDVCSRINLAVYQNGKRVEQINQRKDSTGFGTIKVKLKKGRYLVVVLAHGAQGGVSMSDPQKIVFYRAEKSQKQTVTDTFWYADSITVNEAATVDIKMKRAVAMIRFTSTDNIPQGVASCIIRYNGGSSTFSAVKGVGVVNSRQTEELTVTQDMIGKPLLFEVYTFPHAEADTLDKVSMTAYNSSSTTLFSKEIKNVPIRRNNISVLKGRFFTSGSGGDDDPGGDGGDDAGDGKDMGFTIDLLSEDEWTTTEYSY